MKGCKAWARNLWAIFSVAAILVVTSGYSDEESSSIDEPHIPVGSRCCHVCENDDMDAPVEPDDALDLPSVAARYDVRTSLFMGNALFPSSTHQAIEVFNGPVAIPLTNGSLYWLPIGLYVRLEDTSIWRIMDADGWATQDWLSTDALHIMTNRSWFSSPYRYFLANLNTGVRVRVSPEVGPKLSWSLRRFIYDRNLYTREVILNDGSLWTVSSNDDEVFSTWLPDDSIVIGVNDDWLSYKRPNILINLSTNSYVRCRWIP